MNTTEALGLLTLIGTYDARALPASADDRMTKAEAWAEITQGVPLSEARAAVTKHYRTTDRSITVSDLIGAHVATLGAAGRSAAPCNPLIIDARHDQHGRYEVSCAACGYAASQYADTLAGAQVLRDHHERRRYRGTPPTATKELTA